MGDLLLREKILSFVSFLSILMLISTFAPTVFAGQEEELKNLNEELSDTTPLYSEEADLASIVEQDVPLAPYHEEISTTESSALKFTLAGAAIVILAAGIFYFRKIDKEKDYMI